MDIEEEEKSYIYIYISISVEIFQKFLEVFMDSKKNVGKYCCQKPPSPMYMDSCTS